MKAYTVAVGNLPNTPPFMWSKETRKAVELINSLDGLIGVHPHYPDGMLLLFKTRNDAVSGKNILDYEEVQTGRNIAEVEIDV